MEKSFAKDMLPVIIVFVLAGLMGLLIVLGIIPLDTKCEDLIAVHTVYSNLTDDQKDYIFQKCKSQL